MKIKQPMRVQVESQELGEQSRLGLSSGSAGVHGVIRGADDHTIYERDEAC